ncbi:MAG TPA: hypothetical protein VNO17_09900 [Actinomycetota bacterium]|nr:hypothetical protein [Actinomycetota bacterium]
MADRERDEALTPALRAARERRENLHEQLVAVERAISGPAAGRTREWQLEVRKAVDGLRGSWEDHVLVTERPGGLYEEVASRAPHLAGKIRHLQEHHPQIQAAIEELLGRLEREEIDGGWPVDEARDEIQRLLGRIVKHRQHGADLVWEAYNLDIGGIE